LPSLLMALLIATQFPAFVNEGKTDENGGKQKQTIREGKVVKVKPRVFHVELKFSMEQQDGDLILDDGKTIPGRTLEQVKQVPWTYGTGSWSH
jgi:hypothetical protein